MVLFLRNRNCKVCVLGRPEYCRKLFKDYLYYSGQHKNVFAYVVELISYLSFLAAALRNASHTESIEAEIEPIIAQLRDPSIENTKIVDLCNALYEKLDSGTIVNAIT